MPSASRNQLKVESPVPGVEMSEVQWEGMNAEFISVSEPAVGTEMAPLFKGLPNDRCQAHHWGHVIKGSLETRYADRVETFTAGQSYYIEPGHIPHITEPSEFIEFTPVEEWRKTMEVVKRNVEAAKSSQV